MCRWVSVWYVLKVNYRDHLWDEVCQWLTAQPERNGRSVFDELEQRYPGQFGPGQLRTLQRHIAVWRAKTVLTFEGGTPERSSRLR